MKLKGLYIAIIMSLVSLTSFAQPLPVLTDSMRLEKYRTEIGLAVFTSINRRIYETKTERNPLFESECDKYIVKDEILPKWNYLVRCN